MSKKNEDADIALLVGFIKQEPHRFTDNRRLTEEALLDLLKRELAWQGENHRSRGRAEGMLKGIAKVVRLVIDEHEDADDAMRQMVGM